MPKARTRHSQCIVLDRTKLGESDLILTLLQQDGSQARAIAKGARKPSSKLAGKVQLFCELDMLLASGKNLDIVSEAHLVDPHAALRGDLEKVSGASTVLEIAKYATYDDARDAFLYPITARTLKACEQAQSQASLDLVVSAYVFKVLAHQGWYPSLDTCVSCGEPVPTRFSSAAGGALCESCAKDIEGAEPIDTATLELLHNLLYSTFDQILMLQTDIDTSTFVLALAHSWAATHLDVRLRAFEFMMGITYQ